MNNRKRTFQRGLYVLAIALLFVSCTSRNGEVQNEGTSRPSQSRLEQGAEPTEQVFAVNVTSAIEGQITDYLELSGDIRAKTSVAVIAEVGGEITQLFVDLGQRVGRNARIVEIDPSRPGQRFETNIVRAPIAGTIVQIPAQVGMNVGIGTSVVHISQTDDLEIVTRISERNVSRVSLGQAARLSFDAFPDTVFDAFLSEISPTLDPITRTLTIKLVLRGEQGKDIRPGMYATIRLITEQKQGVVLPSLVLVKRFGKDLVYVVINDETVEEREVQVGIEIDNKIEILNGVFPGERVVYQGQTLLANGVSVRVINQVDFLQGSEGE